MASWSSAPNIIYVKTAVQLVQVVEQEPNALGFAQLALAKQRGLPELVTEEPIEQTLEPHHPGRSDAGDEGRHRCRAAGGREVDVT